MPANGRWDLIWRLKIKYVPSSIEQCRLHKKASVLVLFLHNINTYQSLTINLWENPTGIPDFTVKVPILLRGIKPKPSSYESVNFSTYHGLVF